MYIVLFSFVYVVYSITYVLNKDEIKILENYANGIEKYDKQKEKLSLQNVKQLDNDEEVVQVISMFTPFDIEQRVDVLTKKGNNIYKVYTINYTKQSNSEPKVDEVELKGVVKCISLTYLNNQFVVDCTNTSILFILQNGTQITYNNNLNLQFTEILGFYSGLLGLSPGYLTFFDEQLQMERQTAANYIQVLKDEKNVYLLNELQVIKYSQDDGVFEYNHQCQNKPEFMTILDDTFYIQCGTLRKVNQNEIEVFQLQVSQIQATNQYIIINNTSIFNKDFDFCFFVSFGHLYPLNYDDDVIQIVNNQIQIGSIKGYYLIQSNEISQFKLSINQFYVVDKGLQALTSGESDFYGSEYQVVNYVSGPNIVINDQGIINQPFQLNIEKQLTNKQLLVLLNYLDESIVLIYLQQSKLYSQKCAIHNQQFECEKEVVISQNIPSDIKNVQGSVIDNQIIVAYISQQNLFIYQDNTLLEQVNKVTTYQLYQSVIVILNETQVTINYIINKQLQQQSLINIICIMVTMYSNQIALVDQKNTLLIVSNSNNGWYYSFSKQFQDKITNINYINTQLIVLTDKQAQIYENRILRGKLDLDKIENVKYLQTQTHLYIFNNTKILQFQIFSELSLSSWPQQVIDSKFQSRFLVLSFLNYELLLLDNNLFFYSSILEFTPNTIVDRDVYSRFTYADVIFNNYQNKPVNVKVKVIGDILKLQTLQYNDTDHQINNGIMQIDQTLFFDGPISKVSTNLDDEFEIIQRVNKIQQQPSWINQGLNDLIYIENNLKIVYQNSSLLLCSESKCQSILNNTQDCLTLEQDQIQFYLVCKKSIYSGLKSKPEQIDNFVFTQTSDQLINIKFDQGKKIGIISRSGQDLQFSIYINFKLNEKKVIDELRDFQFNNEQIILLTSKKVMIVDDELKEIQQYDLLDNLIQNEQNFALRFVEFSKICQYKENQYIISSIDGPIYLIYFNKEYSELVLQFTNIQDTNPIETYLIEQQILVCIYQDQDNDYYAAFYDFEDKSKSSLIIPYFNVIKLGSSLTQFHYTRQYNNNSIILVDSSDSKQIFVINDYLQIKSVSSNKNLQELIAYDLDFQQTKINLKIDLTEIDETPDDWILAIYILCGILGILVLLILFRYIRRYCLTRHLKFVEEKPSEFKSEYI
ncbi:unnamed protein product [Paramecium pentaurelia]|uniref:Transmembrane protein n=1 Tax=Paramecium pentaurelia TaxID=43138 RepID=A0A8S1SQY0_9CILI|nr:unnamed protein product [Paramecium pentaurelia]